MIIKTFEDFQDTFSRICDRCGEEYWGDSDLCDDCKDSDNEQIIDIVPEYKKNNKVILPKFDLPTTRSQNIYNL
jgi:hypothetical protein